VADNNTIARPYAEAAFEVASEAGDLAAWSEALEAGGALLADGRVAKFLANPSLTDEQRLQFLGDLFTSADSAQSVFAGDDAKGENFLKLLLEYGRVGVLPEIAEHFAALKAAVEHTVDVTVTAAAPLNDAQKDALALALKERLGCDVRLQTEIDETLIGGAVIRAGDVVIDGSLRARLSALSNALIA
jgi:F-type H+-transporting ATPase subunit delta